MQQKYTLLISASIAIAFSAGFSLLPVGIANQAQVSALYPSLFTPAGFTFSIWSIIYASWILLGIASALSWIDIEKKQMYLLASTQLLSSVWLLPSQFLWNTVAFGVMISLLYLLTLGFFMAQNPHAQGKTDRIFQATQELFFGWILVASIANLHIFLIDIGLYLFPIAFTLVSISIGCAINIFLYKKFHSYISALVFIWASFGIFLGQENFVIKIFAFGALFLTILVLLKSFYRSYKR